MHSKLGWLIESCLTVSLAVNDHRNLYRPLAEHMQDSEEYRDTALTAECIRRDRLCELTVYPETPVGGYHLYGPDLNPLIERMYELCGGPKPEPTP